MANENLLLSKVKIGDVTYDLKDADSRSKLTTLIGTHPVEALGTAAWRAVAASISDGDGKIADAATVKAYVDTQIEAIPKLDIVICPAEAAKIPAGATYKDGSTVITGTMAASASTMYKIYFVKNSDAGSGVYIEWITIRKAKGTTPETYDYSWEQIGSTVVDLSNYVTKTTEIAGVQINTGITKAALQEALGLKDLAYASTAEGSYTPAGSVVIDAYTPAGTITLGDLTQTATTATLTKIAYTPAGSVSSANAITGGSIDVTLKDAASYSEASLTSATYTPTGTIAAATTDGSFSALTSATFGKDDAGVQISGTVSAPSITLTAEAATVATGLTGGSVASFSEGTFTPASISDGFFSAGSQASYSHTGFSGGSLGTASTATFAKKVLKPAIDSKDSEMLIFQWVDSTAAGETTAFDTAVTAQGTFTAAEYGTDTFTTNTLPSIDTTKFSGGSKAADTFTPNVLQSASTATVNNISAAALANAPTFTGDKFRVSTNSDTALKNVVFTATNSANVVNKVEYKKQEVDTKTFTASTVAATFTFAGTEVADALVTEVKYDKAGANGATFTGTSATLTATFTGTSATISVTPKADS